MPYIHQQTRNHLNQYLDPLAEEIRQSESFAGDLNYAVSFILARLTNHELNYARANACVGALECAKQEFYRRVVAPYEDAKIAQNGDVYG
jgi:hypothetical protein